jgi:hypothetical protein
MDLGGTDCCIHGIGEDDMLAAKQLFLQFSNDTPLETTKFGSILRRSNQEVQFSLTA